VLHDLTLRSGVRGYRLQLASALVIPWSDGAGRGWAVAGLRAHDADCRSVDLGEAAAYAAKLREAHGTAGLYGELRLRRDVAEAVRRMAEAQLEAEQTETLLKVLVLAARQLLGTSAAYVSLPDDDGSVFRFSTFSNIRTGPFRRLAMGPGEGLGGLAREEMGPVRSPNYAHDPRLRAAPVSETVGEGIVSAMCAPLVAADGQTLGLLYVANRTLTPFTPTDAAVLGEFSSLASLYVQRSELERYRVEAMRRLEQERLAFDLHDSLVRDLMQIGFAAEAGSLGSDDPTLRGHFEVIGRTAETCLEKVRSEVTRMAVAEASADEQSPVGEVIEALRSTYSRGSLARSFTVSGSGRASLPRNVATGLIRIGQEALENGERHSHGSCIDVQLAVEPAGVVLRVADDGVGMPAGAAQAALTEETGHFGLRRMRTIAKRLGGVLVLAPSERGGLAVQARIPLDARG
jgi:signal transduction histidine kinase